MNDEIWTIEVNVSEDPLSVYAWHIDMLSQTIKRNILNSMGYQTTNHWVLVGLSNSGTEAHDKADKLRDILIQERTNPEYRDRKSRYKLIKDLSKEEIFKRSLIIE